MATEEMAREQFRVEELNPFLEWHLHDSNIFGVRLGRSDKDRQDDQQQKPGCLARADQCCLRWIQCRFVVRINRQLQHGQHLKKKCQFWEQRAEGDELGS